MLLIRPGVYATKVLCWSYGIGNRIWIQYIPAGSLPRRFTLTYIYFESCGHLKVKPLRRVRRFFFHIILRKKLLS